MFGLRHTLAQLGALPSVLVSPAPGSPQGGEQRSGLRAPETLVDLDPGTQRMLHVPLTDHLADAPQILALLAQLQTRYGRSEYLRRAAVEILAARIGNHDQVGQARYLTEFVRDRMIYVLDPEGTEFIISPILLLEGIRRNGRAYGDCDDHVLLLGSLLTAVGIEVRPVGVRLYSPDLFDHVIVQANIRGQGWVDIDPCVRGFEQPHYPTKLLP